MAADVEDDVAVPSALPADDLPAFLDDVQRRAGHAPGSENLDGRVEIADEVRVHGSAGRGREDDHEHGNEYP